ncbi:zinc-binding dehydrogenase [bacterium]|nr:zinc-binding dehydrogenase [bacterium]
MQRRVYRMPKAGNINHLQLVEEPLAEPESDEVQVAVKAIGLNFADIFAMQGLYEATPKGSFIPGLEFSGEVIAIGKNVSSYRIGDRVMGATKFGGYVSHLNHHYQYLTKLPEHWSFEQGAGFVVQGLTAYYALRVLGNLKENQTVLIQSGAGGVGILANRIAKKYHAYTIGTVSSQKKADFLLETQGYDRAIVRNDKEFNNQIKNALDGRELNLVLETIGGPLFMPCYKALAPMGRLITFGSASFTSDSGKPNMLKTAIKYIKRPKLDIMRMPKSNKSVMGFNLIWLYDRVEILHEVLEKLQALEIEPPLVGHSFPFEQMHDAIALFRSGKSMGKVVVAV